MSKTIIISDELHDFIRERFDSNVSFDIAIKTLLQIQTSDVGTINTQMPAYMYNYLILTHLSRNESCSYDNLIAITQKYIEDHRLLHYYEDDSKIINSQASWHIRLADGLDQLIKHNLVQKGSQRTALSENEDFYTVTRSGLEAIEEIGLIAEANEVTPNRYDIYLAWVDENHQSRGALTPWELSVSPLTSGSQDLISEQPNFSTAPETEGALPNATDDPNEIARNALQKFRQPLESTEFSIPVVGDDAIHHYRIIDNKAIPMDDPSDVEQGNSQV